MLYAIKLTKILIINKNKLNQINKLLFLRKNKFNILIMQHIYLKTKMEEKQMSMINDLENKRVKRIFGVLILFEVFEFLLLDLRFLILKLLLNS